MLIPAGIPIGTGGPLHGDPVRGGRHDLGHLAHVHPSMPRGSCTPGAAAGSSRRGPRADRGRAWRDQRAAEALRKAGRDANRLSGYTWHSNRHTFASRLVNLRAVQELGGWRTFRWSPGTVTSPLNFSGRRWSGSSGWGGWVVGETGQYPGATA